MKTQADLLEIVAAAHSSGSFPGSLNCWEQQADQNADDRDNHQQFNEGETTTRPHFSSKHGMSKKWSKKTGKQMFDSFQAESRSRVPYSRSPPDSYSSRSCSSSSSA